MVPLLIVALFELVYIPISVLVIEPPVTSICELVIAIIPLPLFATIFPPNSFTLELDSKYMTLPTVDVAFSSNVPPVTSHCVWLFVIIIYGHVALLSNTMFPPVTFTVPFVAFITLSLLFMVISPPFISTFPFVLFI